MAFLYRISFYIGKICIYRKVVSYTHLAYGVCCLIKETCINVTHVTVSNITTARITITQGATWQDLTCREM
ncbi:hypothetical protein GSQ42_14230 [Clostridioides difficile]|nr:hypothetical protein [Clostridioides difficile]